MNDITQATVHDQRYTLPEGAGSDAVHVSPQYALAVTKLHTQDPSLSGEGFALVLGRGNGLVCDAIRLMVEPLVRLPIEDLMAGFGERSRRIADDPELRWVGPHKGVVHLALASITNACFDLWAKSRGIPLWQLLLDLKPDELLRTLDLSYLDDVIDRTKALRLLEDEQQRRPERMHILKEGYPGYDTSIGWIGYDDEKVGRLTQEAMGRGFNAFKLKVGSSDPERDLRRAVALRERIGPQGVLMFDANQNWPMPRARTMCSRLSELKPLWIEEPTHPDDLQGHVELARQVAPVAIAAGEHIPNRVVFKNFMQAGAMHYVQADCTRLAGVSEFLAVSLMGRRMGLPIVPHVGDMGQIHQHLVLFNHIAMGHQALLLEHIPHLQQYFVDPAIVTGGRYLTPTRPGASTSLKELEPAR